MENVWKLILCSGVGFVLSALIGVFLVPALKKAHLGQSIKTDGPVWHMSKEGTPTMGGLMFMAAVGAVSLLWGALFQDWSGAYVFAFAMVFGFIGFLDDFAKLRHKENTGLSAPAKFLLQLAAAILFTVLLRHTGFLNPDLAVPFTDIVWHLPWPVYMVFAALVMVGAVNAVNLTDGVDGLATGVTIPVMLTFAALAPLWNKMGLGAFSAGLLGGLLGFLIFNFHPAKTFMGDTGSLFLGGAVCGLAFAYNVPLLLVFVGFVYICETLSDILQVTYFKLTHGKRIFLMAPLHHHFEKKGWSEKKVFTVFSLVSALFCLLGWWSVQGMLR